MDLKYGARRRPSRSGAKFRTAKPRVRKFAFLLVALAILSLAPMIVLHFGLKQGKPAECNWIDNPPLVCAHGGDTSIAPPNTFAAYKLALNASVDCIEIDVSRTQDGVLVALHDRELSNMADIAGLHVGDLTFDQIQQLDAARGFPDVFRPQRVPSLDSALRLVSRFVKRVVIDVKVGPPLYSKNLAAAVKSVIERTSCENCVMWSKVDQVVHAYKHLSQAMVGYIVMNDSTNEQMIKPLRISSAKVVGMFHELVNDQLVSSIHREGKVIYAWTVNREEDMITMLHRGVDCVITSKPRLLKHLMNSLRTKCTQETKFK